MTNSKKQTVQDALVNDRVIMRAGGFCQTGDLVINARATLALSTLIDRDELIDRVEGIRRANKMYGLTAGEDKIFNQIIKELKA